MSRAYDNEQTLQQKIMNGANILADNVASTLGPRGRNVLLKEKGGKPFVTKDGVTVAAFVSLEDPFEDVVNQRRPPVVVVDCRDQAEGVPDHHEES